MALSLVDDLLGVVEQEGAEQDQPSVDGNTVQPCGTDKIAVYKKG